MSALTTCFMESSTTWLSGEGSDYPRTPRVLATTVTRHGHEAEIRHIQRNQRVSSNNQKHGDPGAHTVRSNEAVGVGIVSFCPGYASTLAFRCVDFEVPSCFLECARVFLLPFQPSVSSFCGRPQCTCRSALFCSTLNLMKCLWLHHDLCG